MYETTRLTVNDLIVHNMFKDYKYFYTTDYRTIYICKSCVNIIWIIFIVLPLFAYRCRPPGTVTCAPVETMEN